MFTLFTLASLFPLLGVSLAAPMTAKRQNGLTVVNNCYNSGQVALTFDGMSCLLRLRWPAENAPSQMVHISMKGM
jgi:hypothetical protein